jgi:hypothetical protein
VSNRIHPLNLTAHASIEVQGNPVTTRLESSVANCYPGLEVDQRNLDRRFFPGMVFDYLSQRNAIVPDVMLQGARLVHPDLQDPALTNPSNEHSQLAAEILATLSKQATKLAEGAWFLSSAEQKGVALKFFTIEKRKIEPIDGLVVWRLIRGLEPDYVTIRLRRWTDWPHGEEIELSGWRRTFVDPTMGVIDPAYTPGELTQSLCSPWQHDFRDCGCYYWASNHPDIVLGEDPPGQPVIPGFASAQPERANTYVDWLRSNRARGAEAQVFSTKAENRPFQMDHYEINQRWQDLSIVLLGKEISRLYYPTEVDLANPLPDPDTLAELLVRLASLEHVLALEYLYARYSIDPNPQPDARFPTLAADAMFIYDKLLFIATSEMRHLRWVNQLLWGLEAAELLKKKYGPALDVADQVPTAATAAQLGKLAQDSATGIVHPKFRIVPRPRLLRVLDAQTLTDFIAVEAPSASLDGQYAMVIQTLRQTPPYPPDLLGLTERIVSDGMQHYSIFSEIEVLMRTYHGDAPFVRKNMTPGPLSDPEVKATRDIYDAIIGDLRTAYQDGNLVDPGKTGQFTALARGKMTALDLKASELAKRGLGVPFFTPGHQ